MQIPLQVTFRNMEPSEALEVSIREHASRLDRLFGQIMACRVIVEAPHRRHHKGKLYHLRIELTVPGGEVVVGRSPAARRAHEDAYVAIRDAFDAAGRQLQDLARRQRGQVKSHALPLQGRVVKVFPERDYGFVQAPDGTDIYFHRNSVLRDAFDRLQVGSRVRVVIEEGEGENGPQASTIRLVRTHRAS